MLVTVEQLIDKTGLVPFWSHGQANAKGSKRWQMTLHAMKTDLSGNTVCGLKKPDEMVSEGQLIHDDTKVCGSCSRALKKIS